MGFKKILNSNISPVCMEYQELDHWPYLAYQDGSGNLYIHDRDEGLVFVRGKVSHDKYDLTIMIEKDNSEFWEYTTGILPHEQPYGFQIFDEITLREWNQLVKDYIRRKRRGTWTFNEWLKEEIYAPLGKMLWEQDLF